MSDSFDQLAGSFVKPGLEEPGYQSGDGSFGVLIPAWNPDMNLVRVVRDLVERRCQAVIVVDDGSEPSCAAIFDVIRAMPSVHVLRHASNMGKGRALKTGMEFFLAQTNLDMLVTADADGQHAVPDIVRVGRALRRSSRLFVLGSRVFGPDVPLRSRLGNALTRYVFALVARVWLTDTQTGLRAFPRPIVAGLLSIAGERYEYETAVLAQLCREGILPVEVPIETIYIDGNRCSHFDPIRDSMRIYRVLARFYLSKLTGSVLSRRKLLLR